MLLIKINQEVENELDLVDYLNHVAEDTKEGFRRGEGWEVSGEPEDGPAEPNDNSGATEGDR